MNLLKNKDIKLRAMELEDIDVYYNWSNDTSEWDSSEMTVPATRQIITDYVLNNSSDFFNDREVKFVVEHLQTGKMIGYVDIYNFDRFSNRAEIGLFIAKEYRSKGIGSQIIESILQYAQKRLHLHVVYAQCLEKNTISCKLFTKFNFTQSGLFPDWYRSLDGYENVVFMQKILDK